MNWQGAIAILIGALGVAVSFWTAYGGWRARHPRLALSLAYGTIGTPKAASLAVCIRVVNRGAVTVMIESIGLVAPDGRRLTFEPMRSTLQLENTLPARSSATCWISPLAIAEELMAAQYTGTIALRAYCLDALGCEYRSSPVPFDARPHLLHRPGSSNTSLTK
jgi:hypothetical protein